MGIAKWLLTERESLGLSQSEMAKVLGCGSQFVSNMERGKCSMPPAHISMVSLLFNESPEVILQMLADDWKSKASKEIRKLTKDELRVISKARA